MGKGGGKHRGGKGGSKGSFGQGAGTWMFVPAAAAIKGGRRGKGKGAPIQQLLQNLGKGGNRGKGGKGGKGKEQKYKFMDQLDAIDAERKVWVGGLPKDIKRGALEQHFKSVSQPSVYEIMSKGSACIAFKTAEDADLAITSLNGSEISGKEIQVDVWTQKEKKERRPEKQEGAGKKKVKSVIKTSILKGKMKGKKSDDPMGAAMKEKLKAVDHALKVWVGGLSEKTTWKQLKQHFTDNDSKVEIASLMKKGTAVLTFKTEDEVSSAVASINGTEIDGKTIEVDVWTKPERKEKKKKTED